MDAASATVFVGPDERSVLRQGKRIFSCIFVGGHCPDHRGTIVPRHHPAGAAESASTTGRDRTYCHSVYGLFISIHGNPSPLCALELCSDGFIGAPTRWWCASSP